MPREKVQTRCDADTINEIEKYADDREISESEAVRRLVRTGLEAEGYDAPTTTGKATANINQTARQTGTILMLLMLGFLVAVEVGLI